MGLISGGTGAYHHGVDLMERIVRSWGASGVSALVNALLALAIFGFGVAPWVMIPVNIAGVTLYAELEARIRQRSDPR